jgi:hypothetical protein
MGSGSKKCLAPLACLGHNVFLFFLNGTPGPRGIKYFALLKKTELRNKFCLEKTKKKNFLKIYI